MTALNFLFRKPRLPIIIDTGTLLIGAKSWSDCKKRLAAIAPSEVAAWTVIDATADRFVFYPEHAAFSPLTLRKRWTKAAIIDLYNKQKGSEHPAYPTTSLSNKKMEQVVKEIVELLVASK